MGIALLILIVLFALMPAIVRLLRGYMQRRAEDYVRRMMGMPPRPGKRSGDAPRDAGRTGRGGGTYRRQARRAAQSPQEPIIPREYAEDVEYTETKEYSRTTAGAASGDGNGRTRVRVESQVEDVEWEEITTRRR